MEESFICFQAGIKPGQVLRAMSHPTATKEFWDITGGERLRYVRDGINTRRTASVCLSFLVIQGPACVHHLRSPVDQEIASVA